MSERGEKCCTHRTGVSFLPVCGFHLPHSTASILRDLPVATLRMSPQLQLFKLGHLGVHPGATPTPRHSGQGKYPCLLSELLCLTWK